MKKIFIVFALFCLLTIEKANAQLQRGNVIVGADLANFNFGLNKGGLTNINLTPKAAWLLNNNLAFGAYVNLDIITGGGSTYTSYGLGALARYYLTDASVNMLKHGNWFFEGNVGFQGVNIKDGNSTNGLGLGIGPGYAYFITTSIALETLLKFDENVGFGNTISTSDLNLNVGFQIYLPGRAMLNNVRSNEQK